MGVLAVLFFILFIIFLLSITESCYRAGFHFGCAEILLNLKKVNDSLNELKYNDPHVDVKLEKLVREYNTFLENSNANKIHYVPFMTRTFTIIKKQISDFFEKI